MPQFPALRVGLACLARSRFDYAAARQLYHASVAALRRFPRVEVIAPDDIILDNADDPTPGLTERAITFFQQGQIDALVIESGTFAMGDLALDLVDSFHIPVVLWALPEPAESTGRLRLNSLVGLNVNSSHLCKTGRRFRYLVASPGDPVFEEEMGRMLRVLGLACGLRRSKVLLVGRAPRAFMTSPLTKSNCAPSLEYR